jgi:L-lactate utilization protein LutC
MSREAVLGRIRAATGAAMTSGVQASMPTTRGHPALAPPGHLDDPVALFIERASQVGAQIESHASLAGVLDRAVEWCSARGVTRAAVWSTPEVAAVADRLRACGIAILAPGAHPDDIARADVGITGAEWAIAETGSLVLPSGAEQPRLPSLLPPVHLVVLRAGRILPDLRALFARLTVLPSALACVTGPSRSADIGSVPVLGAHGPVELHVWLIERNDDVGQ